jgi:mRNA-degrading endonuclease YafQ of YafQ-DinJ toxin-antitoxin module
MNLIYSDHFKKRLQKRLEKNSQLRSKVAKQLKLLIQNSEHPSLKTHKLKGRRATEYAIWIVDNLRITFVVAADGLLLTDILTHDEY